MPIRNNDCYGSKKEEVVSNYYLNPVAHIRMLPGMKKEGCCGELHDQFFVFFYTAIADRSDTGTFFVGADCAEQIIEKVNAIKKRAGKPPLELPQTFDIGLDGGFVGGRYLKPIKTLNHDVLVLLHLLASVWDVQRFYGAPANILRRVVTNPLDTLGRADLLKVRELIEKAKLFDTISQRKLNGAKIGHFSIPYFNTIIDFIESEQKRH
ncbi:hypothetical protein E0765_07435 [Sulfuricurvum sp. IAE1]|uniref:hypothetical protein n=1 Tax=Sulfuricurvum sp. IAE1 TaxID=2546102 RepID=UPI0010534747|nr:hypothetical protein [Sulfuricurvum sp. IAE1]TDA63659.1 hypothetical protein E0765_07435 [Sulfuricurvum sp. IAE1]